MKRERISPEELPESLRLMAFYVRTPNPDVVVAAVPKGACTSVKKTFGFNNVMQAPVAARHRREGGRIVFFVRDPLQRLNSAYHHFNRGGEVRFPWCVDPNDRSWAFRPEWPTIQHMIDAILDEHVLDRHWAPQTSNLTYEGLFLPTEVYQWGDLTPKLAELTSCSLQFHNASIKRKQPITHRVEELQEYYREDYLLLED